MSSLGEVLKKEEKDNPKSLSSHKISLSYKNLANIGYSISSCYYNITKLFLSNNNISSLSGIEIFKCLTHFSISFNNIEKIEELDKIVNKDLIISLAIKGNMFCKNPISNLNVINKFRNLKDLDGFKISEATFKVIEESKIIRMHIIPFIFVLYENIFKIENLLNTILINLEFEAKYSTDKMQLEEKFNRISTLLLKVNLPILKDEMIQKYLKKNINPSVYVLKKVMECFMPHQSYLKDNFRPSSRNSVAQIFEKLFYQILNLYKIKKNYSELPFYLNYLILKSNSTLEKFLLLKVVENGDYNGETSEYELLKFVCKNFELLFSKYTNYGNELLQKLQMIHFFYLQPPQAKIVSEYQPILENLDQYELSVKGENKFLSNEVVYYENKHGKTNSINNKSRSKSPDNSRSNNPFTSRLGQAWDIIPGKNSKLEFIKKKYDYEYSINFDNFQLEIFFEEGKEKLNLDSFYTCTTNFLNNYSPVEFPIFCLNFDYMRSVTTVIQEKMNEYAQTFEKIKIILKQIEVKIEESKLKEISEFNSRNNKNSSGKINQQVAKNIKNLSSQGKINKNNEDKKFNMIDIIPKNENNILFKTFEAEKEENTFDQKIYKKRNNRFDSLDLVPKQNESSTIKSKSKTRSLSKEKDYFQTIMLNKQNEISIDNNKLKEKKSNKTSIVSERSIVDKSLSSISNSNISQKMIQKIANKKTLILTLSKVYSQAKIRVAFNKIQKRNLIYKFEFLARNLNKINFNFHLQTKRFFFLNLIKQWIKMKNIENLMQRIKLQKKTRIFNQLKKLHANIRISYLHKKNSLKIKAFYSLLKLAIRRKFKNKKVTQSKLYYFSRLLKRGFQGLKYNKYIKKKTNDRYNNFEDPGYNKIYDFFHSGELDKNHNEENIINETRVRQFKESEIPITKEKVEDIALLGRTNQLEYKYNNQFQNRDNNKYNFDYQLNNEESSYNFDYPKKVQTNEVDNLINLLNEKYTNLDKYNYKYTKNSIGTNYDHPSIIKGKKFPNNESQSVVYNTTSEDSNIGENKKNLKCSKCQKLKCHHRNLKKFQLLGAPNYTKNTIGFLQKY